MLQVFFFSLLLLMSFTYSTRCQEIYAMYHPKNEKVWQKPLQAISFNETFETFGKEVLPHFIKGLKLIFAGL